MNTVIKALLLAKVPILIKGVSTFITLPRFKNISVSDTLEIVDPIKSQQTKPVSG